MNKGIFYALLAFFFFALTTIVQKPIVSQMHPSLMMLLAGAVMFSTFTVLNEKKQHMAFTHFVRVALLGFGIPIFLIITGFINTTGTIGGLLVQFQSVATVIFAVLILNETISVMGLYAIALALGGGILLIVENLTSTIVFGDVLVLIGAIGMGYGYVETKRLLKEYSPYTINQFKGLGVFIVGAIVAPFVKQSVTWTPLLIMYLVLFIITGYVLAHMFLIRAAMLIPAWQVGLASQTFPIFVLLLGLTFLGDVLTPLQWVGAGLIIISGLFYD
ncbi:DMT family transporter [Candidatus Woesearchaeota archaeon]|nr:MAG: DMT family transporter [Candidatus Woesearchaeota archaeon]